MKTEEITIKITSTADIVELTTLMSGEKHKTSLRSGTFSHPDTFKTEAMVQHLYHLIGVLTNKI